MCKDKNSNPGSRFLASSYGNDYLVDVNKSVDNYFIEGCLRCPLGGTPDCKVHSWTIELKFLRKLINDTKLNEESKWGVPCYTFQDSNVISISAFKEYCSINFFKGVLLTDAKSLLQKPGKNSQSARLIKFTKLDDIKNMVDDITALINEAIEVEKKGLKVTIKKTPESMPEELTKKLAADPVFRSSFEALTPGRQRGYILHFSSPKKISTRISRIEKSVPKILNGEGMHDKYYKKKN